MEDKNDNTDVASLRGILGGPVMLAAALLVFLVAAQVSGQNGWMDETNLLALPVVAALGSVVGRISSEHPSARGIDSAILVSSLIAISLASTLMIPVVMSMTFLFVALGTHVMVSRGRPMEANFLAGAVIGLHVAILFASTSSLEDAVSDDSTRSRERVESSDTASSRLEVDAKSMATCKPITAPARKFASIGLPRDTMTCVPSATKRKVMDITTGIIKVEANEMAIREETRIAESIPLAEGCSELILPTTDPRAATTGSARRFVSSIHPFCPDTCAATKNTRRAAASITGPPRIPLRDATSVLSFLSSISFTQYSRGCPASRPPYCCI